MALDAMTSEPAPGTEAPGDDAVCVRIDEFTDPLCPWAYSAEPFRRRLRWLYEGRISWTPRMVVLADDAAAQAEKVCFTPEKLREGQRQIARDHKMPIDTRERDYVPGSRDACRAVVAARQHGEPHHARALLRALRVANFSGRQIDRREVIDDAAERAGIEPAHLRQQELLNETEAALEADMAAAREPQPAARVLDQKLANWSGGRRYTCPSYEITRLSDGVTIAVPGFQPFAVYDTILANLVPGLERRDAPETAREVLEWSAVPISSQEVAVMLDVDFEDAREELGRIAVLEPVGADGFWTLADA